MRAMLIRRGWMLLLAVLAACGGGQAVDEAIPETPVAASEAITPPPGARETTEGRIAAALTAGRIDAETALAFRVYALFGDPRLPGDLRATGQGEQVDGNAVVADLNAAWGGMSETMRQALAPFRTRPLAPDSWLAASPARRTAQSAATAVARPACGATGNWTSLAGAVANVRVWYDATRAADLAQAQATVAALDNEVWPTLVTTLGFAAPLGDGALACNGGDARLDVYIVAGLGSNGATWPESASVYQSSTFILLASGLSGSTLQYTVAHQFMHAVEWAYLMVAPQANYGWMRNAMANWAVEAVYPGNTVLLADATCHMNSTFLAITSRSTGACSSSASRTRDYGAYLLYQYIGRTNGNTKVRELLAATTTLPTALQAINANVAGGLGALWPRYAKTLWNQVPVTSNGRPAFLNWDGQTAIPAYAPDHPTPVNADLGGAAEVSTDLAKSVENASTRFYRFDFSDVGVRSVMFHNTFYPLYKAGKKVSVQAMWRTVSGTWVEENWTAKEWIGLCRDAKSQRVDKLVVVVGSGETGAVTQVVAANDATLKRNNIGCWGFAGWAKRTTKLGSWSSGSIVLNSTPHFDYKPNGMASLQYNDAATGRLRVPIAAPLFRIVQWTLTEGYTENVCSYSLSASGTDTSITVGGFGFGSIVMNNFAESLPADMRQNQEALLGTVRGAYTLNAATQRTDLPGTVTGKQPDCGTTYKSAPGMFVLSNDTPATSPVVKLDGHLKGSFVEASGGDSTTWQWDLTPLRQP